MSSIVAVLNGDIMFKSFPKQVSAVENANFLH